SVRIGIGRVRSAAHAGGMADRVFVPEPPPRRRRPHECLVVEAGREEAPQRVVDCTDVEAHGGPAVLACRRKSLVQLEGGCTYVRLASRAAPELHQRVRFLGTSADDAAGAVVLEAAPDQMHAVGEQCRRERIALVTLKAYAVVCEPEWPAAIDASALGKTKRLRHRESPASGSSMRALARMSCVRVSRRTLNQLRQPAPWNHNSSCGPQGLSRR